VHAGLLELAVLLLDLFQLRHELRQVTVDLLGFLLQLANVLDVVVVLFLDFDHLCLALQFLLFKNLKLNYQPLYLERFLCNLFF
jgi:hypothetical protein